MNNSNQQNRGVISFHNKKITVMGLGLHGGAAGNIRYLHEQGAKLTVTDLKSEEDLKDTLASLADLKDVKWVLGGHQDSDFTSADMILRNPAVPRKSKYILLARQHGIPIEMDSSLFFKKCPSKNIIGVTGSKGKSTTTHFLSQLLASRFRSVVMIGTEGTAPLAELRNIQEDTFVIFELSSWRLEALAEYKLSPHTAIVTSIYRDHLNSYESFEEYIEMKKTIWQHQSESDRVFLNYDDEIIRGWEDEVRSRRHWFSVEGKIPQSGICIDRGMVTIHDGREPVQLFSAKQLPQKGIHEQRNTLVAIYLAFTNGVDTDFIKLSLNNTDSLRHRLETIREVNGVTYVNDSAATIPEATLAALKTYENNNVVLILGGGNKEILYENFAQQLNHFRIRGLVTLPGTATEDMMRAINGAYATMPPLFDAHSMDEAIAHASNLAQPGDVVLLSPAATSFGLFLHEFDRGDKFVQAVEAL